MATLHSSREQYKLYIISLTSSISKFFNFKDEKIFLYNECKIRRDIVEKLYSTLDVLTIEEICDIQDRIVSYVVDKKNVFDVFLDLILLDRSVGLINSHHIDILNYINKYKEVDYKDLEIHFNKTFSDIKYQIEFLVLNGLVKNCKRDGELLLVLTDTGKSKC